MGQVREQDFVACLVRLRSQRRVSVRGLSIRTGIPPSTLGGYFSGRHLPARDETMSDLLAGLGVPRDDHGPWLEAVRVLLAERRRRDSAT